MRQDQKATIVGKTSCPNPEKTAQPVPQTEFLRDDERYALGASPVVYDTCVRVLRTLAEGTMGKGAFLAILAKSAMP